MVEGIDYAWGFPTLSAVKKAGRVFVMRYFSHDTGKNLDEAEANALTKAGLWIGVVWESTAERSLVGYAAGQQDARDALAQAKSCNMPDDRPIYFAVDFDTTTGDYTKIGHYLDGAIAILGLNRVGLYAEYDVLKWAFDAHKITWGWQTYAWSNGRWEPRAHIQQYSNGHSMGGVDCDYNRAIKTDYGQWRIGESAMALSDSEVTRIVNAVWNADTMAAPPGFEDAKNPKWLPSNVLRTAVAQSHIANGGIAALTEKIDKLTDAINTLVEKVE